MNYDDHVQLESYEEDEVIIRVLLQDTQKLIDLTDSIQTTTAKILDDVEAYRKLLERESHEAAKRTGQYEEPTF